MSDSGVWGISQEYFDKVYPKQRKPILSGGVKRPCKHGSSKSKDGLNRAIVQPNNDDMPAQTFLLLDV